MKVIEHLKKTHKHTHKDLLYSWIRRTNEIKMVILLKGICRFNAISIKTPMIFIIELEKIALKFI
jgi:hypothetical protein